MDKKLSEADIILWTAESLTAAENFSQVAALKKKYFAKGGLFSQLLQQIAREEDSEKKKELGNLINN